MIRPYSPFNIKVMKAKQAFKACFNFLLLVPGLGFEPKFSLPKSDVLPLDDPGMYVENTEN